MRLLRKISIRFTSVLISTDITANQVTLLSFISGIIAGLLFIFNGWFSVVGALMLQLYCILDAVDGEIARYRKSCSSSGLFLDLLNHRIINPFVVICLSLGLYNALNDSKIFWFGFSAMMCEELLVFVRQSKYLVTGRARVTQPRNNEEIDLNREASESAARRVQAEPESPIARTLFGAIHFPFFDISKPFVIFLVSLTDIIIAWVAKGSLGLNLMYVYLIIYGTLLHSVWLRAALVTRRNLHYVD